MKKTSVLLCVLVCVGLVSMASGEILITNGDFQSGLTGNGDDADVVDWYESTEGRKQIIWRYRVWQVLIGEAGCRSTGCPGFEGPVHGPDHLVVARAVVSVARHIIN